MSRPMKLNEVPVAPWNLREVGPIHEDDVAARLSGKVFRVAQGAKIDPRATIDPSPCPKCGAQVEWAATSKRNPAGGIAERYIYARCRAREPHRWDFRHRGAQMGHVETDTPPSPPAPPKSPRPVPPKPGSDALTRWVDHQLESLQAQINKLSEIKRLASELPIPPPRLSPNGHHRH